MAVWALSTPLGAQAQRNVGLSEPWIAAALGGSIAGNMFFTQAAMSLLSCVVAPGQAPGIRPGDHEDCQTGSLVGVFALLSGSGCVHILALPLLALALRSGSAVLCVTTYETAGALTMAFSSTLVLQEMQGMTAERIVAYWLFLALMVVGMLLVSIWPTYWLGDGERVVFDPEDHLPSWWPRLDRAPSEDGAEGAAALERRAAEKSALLHDGAPAAPARAAAEGKGAAAAAGGEAPPLTSVQFREDLRNGWDYLLRGPRNWAREAARADVGAPEVPAVPEPKGADA